MPTKASIPVCTVDDVFNRRFDDGPHAYCRVSTTNQAEFGASLAAQQAALTAYCATKGWDIEIVVEAGISAKTITDRPALVAALERLDNGEFDFLVATALDRISRSVPDAANLMQRSLDRGWGIATLREAFDPTTAVGRLFANIVIAISAFEREVIGERTAAGMAQRKVEGATFGRPACTPPETVALIRAYRDQGLGYAAIANRLNETGVPTARAHESRERLWRDSWLELHPGTERADIPEPDPELRALWAKEAMTSGEARWYAAATWRLVQPGEGGGVVTHPQMA